MFGNWGEMRSCCSQLDGGGWSRVERRKCKRAHQLLSAGICSDFVQQEARKNSHLKQDIPF